MWKKDEAETSEPERQDRATSPRPTRAPSTSGEPATIGPSITIKGEVSGDEDLLIQGRVNGSVDLKEQSVTVGREGRVEADISGRVVTVEGEVDGDLVAQEQIILRSSARVEGDITAPRVVLEDGARFRGLVDMGEPGKGTGRSGSGSASSTQRSSGDAKGTPADTRSSTPEKASSSSSTPSSEKSESGSKVPELDKATSS